MRRLTLLIVGLLFGGLHACLWALVYQVLRQQGRILLRLEALEKWLDELDRAVPTSALGTPVTFERRNGEHPASQGLIVGAAVPSFRLSDLAGRLVGLDDLKGRRVLLVHWDPQCGFCTQLAAELAHLQSELRQRKVELLLLSYGEAEANRRFAEEHGLTCPILLPGAGASHEVFANLGTPVAYLLDEQGRVARPLALGADQVEALARDVAGARPRLPGQRPLSDSRIQRDGLKAGTPAPAFQLPDLRGEMISLKEYQGRRVLLVFSDPRCGPCEALAPDLVRLHETRPATLALLMVSRGDLAENRQLAEAHGFAFPVVVQPQWKISKEYGIFITPVAYLIDEQGVIAQDVARGTDEIRALIASQIASPLAQ